MTSSADNPLLPIRPAPDPTQTELAPLLDGPFASAWAQADSAPAAPPASLRARLVQAWDAVDADHARRAPWPVIAASP